MTEQIIQNLLFVVGLAGFIAWLAIEARDARRSIRIVVGLGAFIVTYMAMSMDLFTESFHREHRRVQLRSIAGIVPHLIESGESEAVAMAFHRLARAIDGGEDVSVCLFDLSGDLEHVYSALNEPK